MTKYFLVNNASRAAGYGIGTYINQMADCIQECLSQYELFFLDINSDVKEFTVNKDEKGLIHYRVPSYQQQGGGEPYYRYIMFLLSSYIKEKDHVIFHFNYSQHYDLIRLVKAKYPYSRVFYTVHYLNWCFTLNGNLTHFRKFIHNESEDKMKKRIQDEFQNDKRLFSLCDDVIVLSRFTYDLLLTDYKIDPSKIHLVYNGLKENSEITRYCDEIKSTREVLFVGRLDPIKGIEYILKAFKILVGRTENLHLTLVGDGNFSQYLALCEGIWDKVTFTGKLSKEQLEQFYSRATIGIQPSFHEQCSYSAIEMIAHGIPMIATDSTGLGEMMDYTPYCLVHINEDDFQPESFIEQLVEKMELLLSDRQLRKRTSDLLTELFRDRYRLKCMGNTLGKILSTYRMSDGILAKDFMTYLDNEMIRLINNRPILDMDYVGLTGIGCYLWWRICSLNKENNKASIYTSAKLQEHLIYHIDWIYDTIYKEQEYAFSEDFEPIPFLWLLHQLQEYGFYKTKLMELIELLKNTKKAIFNREVLYVEESTILQNALKIYNTNF